jgi:hypothetical protein
MMFDPILCTQEQQESIKSSKAIIYGKQATVPVMTSFSYHSFEVELLQIDGIWKIDYIITLQIDKLFARAHVTSRPPFRFSERNFAR